MPVRTYLLSAFTTSSGQVNSALLKRELNEAGLSVLATRIACRETDCLVETDTDPTVGDETIMDGVVTAHTGEGWAPTFQHEELEAEASDDTGDEIVRETLSTGIMPEGTYLITFGMELQTTNPGAGVTAARGYFRVSKNGSGLVEKGQHNNGDDQWKKFSESYSVDVVDGDQFTFQLSYVRVGTSGNAARARFARITWARYAGS